jgi:folate-binding protein YgfZ
MVDASFVILDNRGVLAVSRADRRGFLQGLVSNDIEKVAADTACYAALLTAQGKYLHDFIIVEAGESIWLDTEAARLGDLKRRLSTYRLRAQVSLDEQPDLAVVAAFGRASLEALGLPERPGVARPFSAGVALVDPRLPALGGRVLLPHAEARAALVAAGFVETGFESYDRLRLSLGIPDGSRDLTFEKSILLEAGFDELNGVDWQKGCYIGQELTARTKYRGLVKRRLMPVHIEGPAPAPGTVVTADGRDAGEMRSSRDGVGLAVLRLEPVLEGKGFMAGDAQLIPVKPNWMRLEDDGRA